MLAGLVHAEWRSTPAARSIASSGAATALAHDLARQGSPSFPAAIAASVLLHVCLLAALLVMHHREPHASDVRSLAVTLTAEDPAVRVGERAGVAWSSAASRAAIAALLAARRDAALMDELVVTLVHRRHPATGSSSPTATASRTVPRGHATLAAATASPTAAPSPPSATPPSAAPASLPVVAAADPIAAPSAPPAATALAPSPPMATPVERLATAAAPTQPGPPVPPATPPPAAASAPAVPAPPPTQPSQAAVAAAPPLERSATGDADRSYFDAVLRRLQRLKDYPGLARYHTSGRVEVAFRVARDGTVLAAEVHRSSGYSFLDKAGIDLIYRASPLPALPATLPGESWPIVVPISFRYD